MNGVQTRLKCKPNVKRCKRFVFPVHSPLLYHNTLTTKAIKYFQANHILTRFVFPPLDAYIAKPFSIKLLLARVFRLIEQRDKLREKFSSEPGIVRAAVCSTDRDKEFADRLAVVLEQNLSRPEFSIDEFAQLMKLGRTVFYRKLRGVTGYSPNEYLRVVRMKKAAELLLSGENLTVAEVAYKVGISDPFYFSKCFKTQFGVAPSVYQRGEMKEQGENETAEA